MSSRRARARRPAALLAILFLGWVPAAAARNGEPRSGEPEIPAPAGYVNDRAGVMDGRTRARLEAFLDQLERKTGAQFAVLAVRTTAPLTPGEYKVRVFERWGLGRRGEDDGLLMLVAVEEREVRFETGYGLEGTLPDGLQSRIFREQMTPRFRAGDYGGGIVAGVLACAGRIAAEKGTTLEWDGRELRYDGGSSGRVPWWALFMILALMILLFSRLRGPHGGWYPRRRRARWGRFDGGVPGGGFGGWSGGFGGRSFGGFGGGASGGGGGGGRW